MDDRKLRAWWAHRQGLDGAWRGATAAEVLARAGWARSVGGVGPYLTLWSRGGIGRAAADAAAKALAIHELPAARGCVYVVPAEDYAVALKIGQAFAGAEMKTAAKLGVTEAEIDKLCDAVEKVLAKATLAPDAIRDAVGGKARSLGEAGKKKGLTTTLPVALGRLQAEGAIRRVPEDGRLDQQRYRYTAWSPSPLAKSKLTERQAQTEVARKYFRWIGPARLAEAQWFLGLSGKVMKEVLAPLELAAAGDDFLILPGDLAAWKAFEAPAKPEYKLVSSLDAIVAARRELQSLIDAKDRDAVVPLGGVMDLPSHPILDRGRIVGLWEFDPDTQSIAWAPFGKRDKAMASAVEETEAFIRDELGDARSFSLDSPKSRAPRIKMLRA